MCEAAEAAVIMLSSSDGAGDAPKGARAAVALPLLHGPPGQGANPPAAQAHQDAVTAETWQDNGAAPYGYDVSIQIRRATGLMRADWYGSADPYVVADVTTPAFGKSPATQLQYKTRTVWRTLSPGFWERFDLVNVPAGTRLHLSVMDKDAASADDLMGTAEWTFEPWGFGALAAAAAREDPSLRSEVLRRLRRRASDPRARLRRRLRWLSSWRGASWRGAARQTSIRGDMPVELPLAPPPAATSGPWSSQVHAGRLALRVAYRPSAVPGVPRTRGPVRFRENLSLTAGLCLGRGGGGEIAHSTYKLFLHDLEAFFGDARCPWNRNHPAAAAVFNSNFALSTVRAQHATLYAQGSGFWRAVRALLFAGCGGGKGGGVSRGGLLSTGDDLCEFLDYGLRGGRRVYYTYSLLPDGSLRFSQTGAAFLADVLSKHATHSGGAEEVVYAGEFAIFRASDFAHARAAAEAAAVAAAAARDAEAAGLAAAAAPDGSAAATAASEKAQAAAARAAAAAEAAAAAARAARRGDAVVAGKGKQQQQQQQQQQGDVIIEEEGDSQAEEGEDSGLVLVIDNNSGTYAPPADRLPAMAALLEKNFPGLKVETVDATKQAQLLALLHAHCPSRIKTR